MRTTLGAHMLRVCSSFLALGVFLVSNAAQAVPVRATITVDNSYALFYGTQSAATAFVGTDPNWPSAETYEFDLPQDHYLYVVTASDLSTAQGFLGQFSRLNAPGGTPQFTFYSNDSAWQVMATGLGANAPYSGTAANLNLLSNEINDANSGGNASGGWVGLTAGGANGVGPWGAIAGINSTARWTWFSSNGDPDPTSPGFNHQEWLVFRIAVDASPSNPIPSQNSGSVPLPGSLALLALGLVATVGMRRRG